MRSITGLPPEIIWDILQYLAPYTPRHVGNDESIQYEAPILDPSKVETLQVHLQSNKN